MRHYISKPDSIILNIIAASFPSYNGKKISLSTEVPTCLNSYWQGGSKNSYAFVQLSTMKQFNVHTNHPFFEPNQPRDLEALPLGVVLVEHSIFCGKDMGITIYANSQDLTPLLPPAQEVTEDEKTVLYYTRSLKSSYAGISNYRFVQAKAKTGITEERWESAKASLISKKFLNKAGAITAEGRNVCPERI